MTDLIVKIAIIYNWLPHYIEASNKLKVDGFTHKEFSLKIIGANSNFKHPERKKLSGLFFDANKVISWRHPNL